MSGRCRRSVIARLAIPESAPLSARRGRPPKKLPGDYLRNEQVNAAWHGSSDRGCSRVGRPVGDTGRCSIEEEPDGTPSAGRHPLLDGAAAPVGTWFSKNLLLFESGIISDRLWRDIERVRQIRDRFAQEWSCNSLEDPKVHSQLPLFDSLSPPGLAENAPHRDRSVFIAAVFSLMQAMDQVCKQTRARRPKADEQIYDVAASSKATDIRMGRPRGASHGVNGTPRSVFKTCHEALAHGLSRASQNAVFNATAMAPRCRLTLWCDGFLVDRVHGGIAVATFRSTDCGLYAFSRDSWPECDHPCGFRSKSNNRDPGSLDVVG
jgi:hypothetical protein